MNKQLVSAIEKHWQQAVELSDDLYAHPELPDQEFRSSQKVVDMLKAAGYEVEYPYMGYPTGFRAVLKNGEGLSAALLIEYDALPELGHACGHNAHCAMAVLAALALAEAKDQFQGTVYAFGTPAEEENGAKIGMAAKGAFDGLSLATREVEEVEKQRYADPHVAGWFDQCAQWLDLVFLHPHASA